jgi:hypothetical protein
MSTGTNRTDVVATLTKGALGAIPFVGGLAAEVVGAVIPNQRMDRIARLVKVLESKVETLDKEQVRRAFTEPGFVDILEDGFVQAARSLNEERIEHIASLLKNGLTEEHREFVELKKLLYLLAEINDIEVIVLRSYGEPQAIGEESEFRKKHANLLSSPGAHLGSSQDELDDQFFYDAYRLHLVRLGLLRPRFKKAKRGELPPFDEKTGMIQASGHELTPLGRLLLKNIEAGKSQGSAEAGQAE